MGLAKNVWAGKGNEPEEPLKPPPERPAPWAKTAPPWRATPPPPRPRPTPKPHKPERPGNIFSTYQIVDGIITGTAVKDPKILARLEQLRPLLLQCDDQEPVSYCHPLTPTAVLKFLDFLYKKLNYRVKNGGQPRRDLWECCTLIRECENLMRVRSHEQR